MILFSLLGRSHQHCGNHDQENSLMQHDADHEFEDQHTCCYETCDESVDLTVEPMSEIAGKDKITVHNVMKCGGDNFSLVSKHVKFITDELLVDQKAEECILKYFPAQLSDIGCMVCIGEFEMERHISKKTT